MTKVVKRASSLLLALVMALTLLPGAALADNSVVSVTSADELAAALGEQASADGGTVTLSGDLTLEKGIRITGSPIILDLSDYTLALYVSGSAALDVNEGGSLTIRNGKVTSGVGNQFALRAKGGTLTLEDDLTVESTAKSLTYPLIQANGDNKSGTAVYIDGADVSYAAETGKAAFFISAANQGRVDITNGSEINVSLAGKDYSAVSAQTGAEVNITGAVITCDTGIAVNVISGATVTVSGETAINAGGTGIFVGKGSNPTSAAAYEHATLNFKSGTVTAGSFGIATNGMDGTYAAVNVSGGSVTSSGSCGVYLPSGSLNLSGEADITGVAGIVVRGGTLIAGDTYSGTIRANAPENGTIEAGDAGYAIPAAGIAIDCNTSYGNNSVAINGGTVVGGNVEALSYTKGGSPAAGKPQDGDTVSVSGGAFSSSVDPGLLSGDVKFEAENPDNKDAPYSYHKTEDDAKKAAGENGGFKAVSPGGGSSGDDSATYTVTIASGIANGAVTASPASAAAGETVTLTVTPNSGYQLNTLTTTPALTLSGSGNTRTFTMPASNVTVSATFTATSSSSALTGYVSIVGEPWVGETLTAVVRNTNNTGILRYQWSADNVYISGETSSSLVLTGYEVGKIIRCVVTSTVQTGSISGRFWTTVDYYNNRYSPAESPSNNNTGTNQSGNTQKEDDFTLESPIFTTATNADGTKTTTIIQPDGSSGLVMLTSYGTVSSASMTFSTSAFGTALRTGSALTLPASVQPSRSAGSAAPVRIVLPQSTASVNVKIPVSQMTAGTVAVMENYFGPDTVIRSSVSESNGVLFKLMGSAVVKIVDNSRSFQDVSDGAWYANAVKWAASREVMNGVSAQRFDPQGTVNRAMMAQMLFNFDGAENTGIVSQFSDVSSKDWYAASVSWAVKSGIARSYGNRFGAEDALTREDMALMLYNYAKAKGYNTYANGNLSAFSDNGGISDWASAAMQWAVGTGLITGTQNGTRMVVLDPQGTVTRAQLATIMQRFNNLY